MSAAFVEPLGVENTVQVASVRHRLAMGVQWIDALTQLSAFSTWTSELERIGSRACPLRFDAHPQCRHALRAAGRLARVLAVAAEDKATAPPATPEVDQTNFVLRAFGRTSVRVEGYAASNDPRQLVPRRLSLTPAQTDGVPAGNLANIRTAWLWPGSAYPLTSNVTALRGCVRRGPSDAVAKPAAWSRIVVSRPGAGPADFDTESKVGYAHGDDRGEFLVVLGGAAVPGGAALPATIALRLWVFTPPADIFDEADPLASLPLEVAGSDGLNDVLRGTHVPAAYVRRDPIDVTLVPGRAVTVDRGQLLFV